MTFIGKIEQILEWIDFIAIEYLDGPTSFEAGLAPANVAQKLAGAGVPPLPELVQLYSWANGCDFIHGSNLMFPSLDWALRHFDDWHPDYGRPRTWFPVATMNGDMWIYLDVETLALHSRDVEIDVTRKLADHYEVALDALIDGLSADGSEWDEDESRIHLGPGVAEDVMARFSVDCPW